MAAWAAPGGAARFEANVPLLCNARRARALGFAAEVDLVFLEGLDSLEASYVSRLREAGYAVRDAGASFRRHAARHLALGRFGRFERNCFLRWLVLADLYAGQPLLHLDGDVVFNESPAELARLCAGRTLVLQGCPAFVALADGTWLARYAGELGRLAADIEGYSAAAWAERPGWEESARLRWAGSRDRRVIASDQDLISHLLHTRRLPQADPAEFVAAAPRHVFFENPLLIGQLVPERPLDYRRSDGIDTLGGRRVAFWHMQTDWCRYLAKHLLRERLGGLAGSGRVTFGRWDRETLLHAALRKLGGGRWWDRATICRRFFEEGNFAAVFCDAGWWEETVFPASGCARTSVNPD
jgi:hypothetical protein